MLAGKLAPSALPAAAAVAYWSISRLLVVPAVGVVSFLGIDIFPLSVSALASNEAPHVFSGPVKLRKWRQIVANEAPDPLWRIGKVRRWLAFLGPDAVQFRPGRKSV